MSLKKRFKSEKQKVNNNNNSFYFLYLRHKCKFAPAYCQLLPCNRMHVVVLLEITFYILPTGQIGRPVDWNIFTTIQL